MSKEELVKGRENYDRHEFERSSVHHLFMVIGLPISISCLQPRLLVYLHLFFPLLSSLDTANS